LVNIITTLSPQKIIMGGGVMQKTQLFSLVREEVQSLLNKYLQVPEILDQINDYIVPPALGGKAGILGAIALVQRIDRS
jgi:fructokinase